MRKVTLLIFLVFLTFQTFAQLKPRALKFDEFLVSPSESYYYNEKNIDNFKRIHRLIAQVKKMRGVKVYVISYRTRKDDESTRDILKRWANDAQQNTVYETKLKDEDVILLDGGYRDADMLEFWIVPKNADPPVPSPLYEKEDTFACPSISVYANIYESGMSLDPKVPVVFEASTRPEVEVSYKWTTSAGRIIDGQGTRSIEVDLAGNRRVTAFVEISGLPLPCNRVAFATAEVGKRAILIDEDERYQYSELAARIDAFMIQINSNPKMTGAIIVYADRTNGTWDRNLAMASVAKVFAFRKFELDRVKLIKGGYREYNSVDFYLLPEGVDPPKPTPTVDERLIVRPLRKIRAKKRH